MGVKNQIKRFSIFVMGIVVGMSMMFSISTVTATPGGLDSKGGHHCWTDCGKYGKYTGQYHCHKKTKACRKSRRNHRSHGH